MLANKNSSEYLKELLSEGRSYFTLAEYCKDQGVSEHNAKAALMRLKKKKELISPYDHFYVIMRPEEIAFGSPAPENYIPALMKHLKRSYYAGLLTAAEWYGAAHQRPQEFQVVTDRPLRMIKRGRIRIRFVVRGNIKHIPTQQVNTRAGYLLLSTPEATAFDLLEYPNYAAGIDNVATILTELGEKLDADKLLSASRLFATTTLQRLGFILEQVGHANLTLLLKDEVERLMPQYVGLDRKTSFTGAKRDRRWRLAINHKLDPDI